MEKIMLVDDNPHIMKVNSTALKMKGYEVLCADSLSRCSELLQFHTVDIIVLDVLLPDGNGIDFCKKIKKESDAEIIFLSALGSVSDIVSGLKAGGDDYLSKPYDLEVLVAKIDARLRRKRAKKTRRLTYFHLTLDLDSMIAYIEEEDLLLTKKEFLVLYILSKYAETVVDKNYIYEKVWGGSMVEGSKALWTVISRLKKKLNPEQSGITISSQRAEGYMLERV